MGLFALYCYNRAMKNPAVIKNTLIFLIVVFLFPLQLQAESVTNLYHTVVPVADQSGAERLRAMRIGLGKVLVKVTGDSQALANVSYSNPERYVTEFGYVSYRDPLAPKALPTGLGMSLNYAASAIDQLLRQYQQQVWPSDRPGLLVWMVVDDPIAGRSFVTAENMPEAVATLKMLMEDRGAPLILPLLDLQDTRNVSEMDVWNLNQAKLTAAAQRYNTSAWLALRLYQSSTGQWRATRLLNLKGDDSLHNVVAGNVVALMTKVVPGVVDNLASQYAYVPKTDTETVFLQLENINDYQTFNDATNYLESLEVVRRLTVSLVDNDRLGLQLFVEGEVDLLLDTLRRDRRMTEKRSGFDVINTEVVKTEVVKTRGAVSVEDTGINGSGIEGITTLLPQPKNFYFIWGRR